MDIKKEFDNEILLKSFDLIVNSFVPKDKEYVNKLPNVFENEETEETDLTENTEAEIHIEDSNEKTQEELDKEYEIQKAEFYKEQSEYQENYEKQLEKDQESVVTTKKRKSKKSRKENKKKPKEEEKEQLLPTPPTTKFPFPIETVDDESLKNMLISWYYSGYYTGYHEAQKKFQKE